MNVSFKSWRPTSVRADKNLCLNFCGQAPYVLHVVQFIGMQSNYVQHVTATFGHYLQAGI